MSTPRESRSAAFREWKMRHFPKYEEDFVWLAYVDVFKLAIISATGAVLDQMDELRTEAAALA